MKDVEFLYDDTHLEKKELERIADIATKKPEKKDFNAVILRKFTLALINAVAKQKELEKPKAEIKKIPEEKKLEIPSPKIPIKEEKEEKIIPVKPIPTPKPEFPEYPIIKNAENKVLARARLKDNDYFLEEPQLTDKDRELLRKLTDKLERKIVKRPELVNDKNFMVKMIQKFSKKLKIPFNLDYFDKIRYYFVRNMMGYSRLDPLIQDPHVKEIHFIGLHKPLKITFNEQKDVETNITFDSVEELNNIIKKFFDKAKQKLTRDNNYLDSDVLGFQVKALYDFDLKESKLDIKK